MKVAAIAKESAFIFTLFLKWHSRGRRFDPDYLHHLKDKTLQVIAAFSFFWAVLFKRSFDYLLDYHNLNSIRDILFRNLVFGEIRVSVDEKTA